MSFLKLLLWVLLPIALLGAGAFALIAWRRCKGCCSDAYDDDDADPDDDDDDDDADAHCGPFVLGANGIGRDRGGIEGHPADRVSRIRVLRWWRRRRRWQRLLRLTASGGPKTWDFPTG
jgi:hypothetical protein